MRQGQQKLNVQDWEKKAIDCFLCQRIVKLHISGIWNEGHEIISSKLFHMWSAIETTVERF